MVIRNTEGKGGGIPNEARKVIFCATPGIKDDTFLLFFSFFFFFFFLLEQGTLIFVISASEVLHREYYDR